MLSALPEPLTPADCELRDFPFMPLDVVRLRDSDLAVKADADEFRCAVLLWCASWHQIPAASLPDDDKALAQYAGYGRVVKEWMKVRDGALRGWVKCSDGRLYHEVVAEKANDAWIAKLKQRLKTECARIKKHNDRHGTRVPFPDFDSWMCAGCPSGQQLPVPRDTQQMSLGTDPDCPSTVPREKHSKGQGEGQGQGEGYLKSKPESSSQASNEVGELESSNETTTKGRNIEIISLLTAQGVHATPQDPVSIAFATDPRITDAVLLAAIAKAQKAKAGEDIGLPYLLRCVESVLKAQAKTVATIPAQLGDAGHWSTSAKGIEAMGASLGMHQNDGELIRDYGARIQREIDSRKGQP